MLGIRELSEVALVGLEPTTHGLGIHCSIHTELQGRTLGYSITDNSRDFNRSKRRSSPKILGREERLLAGFGISGGKTAVKAALLAEEMRLDPIGQGIEAEVWNAEHAAGRQEHVSG